MAEGLSELSALVVLNSRDIETLEAAANTLRDRDLRAEALAFDVTDHQAAKAAIDSIVERHGKLDILIANAGIHDRAALADWRQEV